MLRGTYVDDITCTVAFFTDIQNENSYNCIEIAQ